MGAKTKVTVGQEFGHLLVLKRSDVTDKDNKLFWSVLCRACGNVKPVRSSSLLAGDSKSCGCLKGFQPLPIGMAARNAVYHKYEIQARERNLAWSLTGARFDEFTSQACHYCGLPPSNRKRKPGINGDFVYSGLDRMDNLQGYEEGNVVPCCIECNRLKGKMPYSRFTTWLDRIVSYHLGTPQNTTTT